MCYDWFYLSQLLKLPAALMMTQHFYDVFICIFYSLPAFAVSVRPGAGPTMTDQ